MLKIHIAVYCSFKLCAVASIRMPGHMQNLKDTILLKKEQPLTPGDRMTYILLCSSYSVVLTVRHCSSP